MHVIAAKAVAFGEALRPEFKAYAVRVIANARALSDALVKGGLDIVSGGTDCHMVLVDLRPKGVRGRDAEQALERAGLTCNKNAIPFDPEKPAVTSGVRLGSSAATTRGFGEAEFRRVGELILRVIDALAQKGADGDAAVEQEVRAEVEGSAAASRYTFDPLARRRCAPSRVNRVRAFVFAGMNGRPCLKERTVPLWPLWQT